MYKSFTSFVRFILNIFYTVINDIFLFSLINSLLFFLFKNTVWWPQLDLGPVHKGCGVGLEEMVSEFLIDLGDEQPLSRGQG